MGIKRLCYALLLSVPLMFGCENKQLKEEARQIFATAGINCKQPYIIDNGVSWRYITVPEKPSLLCVKFNRAEEGHITTKQNYTLEKIVCKNADARYRESKDIINLDTVYLEDVGEGAICLFRLKSRYFKGEVNPENLKIESKGLEKYLKDEKNIEASNPLIKEAALKAIQHLSPDKKSNPYYVGEAIVDWVHKNITYFELPHETVEKVVKAIESLPEEKRDDPYEILQRSFNLKKGFPLRLIADSMGQPELEPKEMAMYILRQLNHRLHTLDAQYNLSSGTMESEWVNHKSSALKTLKNKMGKCTGMSKLFVAMSRSLGIPTKMVHIAYAMFADGEGGHAWPVLWLPKYGWKEVDPTWNQFGDFSHDEHAYEFSSTEAPFDAAVISDGACVDKKLLNECKALLDD